MSDEKIIIDRCYVCNRIQDESGNYIDVEDFLEHENSEEDDFDFSDGVCPDCYELEKERMLKELEELDEDIIE